MNSKISKKIILIIISSLVAKISIAQKEITLEDIWSKKTFKPAYVRGINWMKDGDFYSSIEKTDEGFNIIKNKISTGEKEEVIVEGKSLEIKIDFDGYEFNGDESKILFTTETENIYRRSSKSIYHLYDLKSKKVSALSSGKQMFATYSPDADKVAFVKENNLYYLDIASNKEIQVTKDGLKNKIINGWSDWVYEEEFGFAKAFFWSPDGSKLAYYRFDETDVPEYNMQMWGGLYPEDYRFKYPKAGEKNSVVEIKIFDLETGTSVDVNVGDEKYQYIPRVKWTNNSSKLLVYRMNRLQNKLEILEANSSTGVSKTILSEENKTYVEIYDDVKFMDSGFIMASEMDGFKHLYYYNWNGTLINQITKGNWDVVELKGVDEEKQVLYFTSAEPSPMQRDLYRINFDGSDKIKLTTEPGTHSIDMSPDTKHFIDVYSNANQPPVYSLCEGYSGAVIKKLKENKELQQNIKEYAFSSKNFFKFKTSEGVSLNGYMIMPSNFDAAKKYPVLMHVYGGPGINTVNDAWGAENYVWYQMLAQKGYIIVSIDGRGTGYRGADFKKVTYGQLGKYESDDQIEGAKHLATLPYIDKNRIGIWGWSFGGYITSLSLTKTDLFKMGIAVAPVTTWRYYDSIYTERYLGLPKDNTEGYDNNSPIQFADRLSGKFLLVHGTGDDNVHYQNTVDFHDALIKANKQFSSFYYPNRKHGISGGNTRLHLYYMMTDFILENL